jgi:stress response protein YsnF
VECRLREERVTVERHPDKRPPTDAVLDTFRDETMEFTETAEEAVVSRRARVVEEVTVQKDVAERTEMVHETVRRTHVDVDHEAVPSASGRWSVTVYASIRMLKSNLSRRTSSCARSG